MRRSFRPASPAIDFCFVPSRSRHRQGTVPQLAPTSRLRIDDHDIVNPVPLFRLRSQAIFLCRYSLLACSDPLSKFLQYAHTTRSNWRSTFRRHVGTCASPCSCGAVVTTSSCEIPRFPQDILGHNSTFDLALRADVHIGCVSVSSFQHTSTWMTRHKM